MLYWFQITEVYYDTKEMSSVHCTHGCVLGWLPMLPVNKRARESNYFKYCPCKNFNYEE